MEWFVALLFLAIGACVGSFLNVVVLRFGFRERQGERSHCAACSASLTAWDLVPIFSYAALSGRCRHCGSHISLQYPLVEAVTALVFLLTYLTLPASTWLQGLVLIVHLGFWSAFVALVVYDIRHTLIPYEFLWWLLGFGVLGAALRVFTMGQTALWDSLWGAIVCGGFFALIHLVTRGKGMGLGDAYVAGIIGLMFGLSSGIAASAFGVWAGALVGILLLAATRVFPHARVRVGSRRVTLKTEIPFAPFLAFGAFVAFLMHIPMLQMVSWVLLI